MGLILRCTGCTASARLGVRRGVMSRLGLRDSHACTPHFEFLGEGDRGSVAVALWPLLLPRATILAGDVQACVSPRPMSPKERWRTAECAAACVGRQTAFFLSSWPTGNAIREPAAASNGSDAGRTQLPDGDPHSARIPAVSGPPFCQPLPPTRLRMRETATPSTTKFRRYQ